MKTNNTSQRHSALTAALAVLAALLTHFAASSASAATYYWDTDGTTAGFGDNAGTWGADAFWSTNTTGGASSVFTDRTTTNDLVNFAGTGTLALGSTAAAVTVSGTVEAGRITFGVAQPSGVPVVLTGGTISLGGTNAAPHIAPNSTNATINSAIVLNSDVQLRGPNGGAGGTVMTLKLNGAISGGFNVTFYGPSGNNNYSTVVLGAQNTYTGSTLLQCIGTGANIGVKLGTDDALPPTTVLTLDGGNAGGTAAGRYVRLDLNGYNQTLAGLTTVVRGARRDQCIVNSSATAATLTVNNAADYTFTGQLGSGGNGVLSAPNFGLTKDGVGKLTLSPANTNGSGAILNLQYTGPTTINNGILELANAGQLGNGNYAANISIASGAALVFSGTNNNTLSGAISGRGRLTNSGTGTVTITGTDALANTVAANGSTIVLNGGFINVLTVNDGGKLSLPGPTGGTVTNLAFANSGTINLDVFNGGTLACAVANGITNNGGAGSITVNITGSVPAFGIYTLISYSGSLHGSGFSAYQLGTTPGGAAYTLNDTGSSVQLIVSPALVWTGAQSGEWSTNPITPLQNWTFTGNPVDYTNGLAVIFNDSVGAGTTTVDVSAANVTPASVQFENDAYSYTLQGSKAIAGASGLTKNGSGALTVLNNNTYSGATRIGAGIVQVGNGGTSGSLGSGGITDNGNLQFNRSDNISIAAAISGTGALEQSGSGVLTLSGPNTYGGATTINAGILRLGGSNVLPDGSSITANGLLDLNTFSDTVNGLSGSGTVDTVAGGAPSLTVGANNAGGTFSGAIQNTAGTLSLSKAGTGTLTLAGANAYSGGTTIAGGVISANGGSALGTGPVVFNGGTRLLVGSGITITNPITLGTNSGVTGRGLIEPASGAQATISGPITINTNAAAGGHFATSGTGAILDVAGPITSSVSVAVRVGTVRFSGGGGHTNLTLNQGTVMVGTNNGIATSALFVFLNAGAGILDLNGFNQSLVGMTKGTQTATIGNSSTTSDSTLTTTGTSTFGGAIQDVLSPGTMKANLAVNGGTLTLTGTNTYAGATTISGGTLQLGDGTSGNDGTIANTAGVTNNGSLVFNRFGNSTASYVISGSGSVTKTGSGQQTLTAANTYSGATTISAGTLALANDAAINLTSGLSIAAGATLDTVALTVPPPSTIPLTASGTGTNVGTTAAAIIGVSGFPHDLGSRLITLNYDGANPALYLSGGTLNLNNNPFTIHGSVLANGVYTIIAQSDAPAMTGLVASSTVNGTALTGKIGTVSLSGNTVVLAVSSATPPQPTIAPVSVSGTNLVVTVATTSGCNYVLQSATNLTPTIHWQNESTNVGTGGNLILNMPIDPALPQKFLRFWVY